MTADAAPMVKLVFCVRRHPSLSREDFQRYWLERHGPLVRSLRADLPMVRYVQSHSLDDATSEAARAARGMQVAPYDGVTEVWLAPDSPATATEASRIAGQRLLEDEATFIDLANSTLFNTIEHAIF